MQFRTLIQIGLFILPSIFLIAWGWRLHKIINENAPRFLPTELTLFIEQAAALGQHASDADTRKNSDPAESSKHFIDIDEYQEFFDGSFPHEYLDALQTYGVQRLTSTGLLPWSIAWTVDSVTSALSQRNWEKALLHAADLGHYVGDLSMPLHLTKNYDGQFTNNNGIHSRYEAKMIDAYYSSIVIQTRSIQPVFNTLDSVFAKIERGWKYKDVVLGADNEAVSIVGKNNFNIQYYSILWDRTREMTIRQANDAAQFLAELLTAAWHRAGKPMMTAIDVFAMQTTGNALLQIESIVPNPSRTNSTVHISSRFPTDAMLHLRNMLGEEVWSAPITIRDTRTNTVTLSSENFPSGVYYLSIEHAFGISCKPFFIVR